MNKIFSKSKISNQSKLIDNLTGYLFSARLRNFKIEENKEFTYNVSERVKIRKDEDGLILLFSYGFMGDLIDKTYDKKRNTFIQRVTNKSLPDSRIVLSKRKYFTLKDLALHIILLSVDNLKVFKSTINFSKIKNYDMNIYNGIHDYLKYVNTKLGVLENDLLLLIEENFASMIQGESPEFNEFIGKKA